MVDHYATAALGAATVARTRTTSRQAQTGRRWMTRIAALEYPATPHARRHGPAGYTDYASYRDWLRDEFCFRCVFCLWREQWLRPRSDFEIDHLLPQKRFPQKVCDYDNLLYACSTCNSAKGDQTVPDPCSMTLADGLRVYEDGRIEGLNDDGKRLIEILNLDSEDQRRCRRDILLILRMASNGDQALLADLLRFPDELPDLSRKNPPNNSRPGGIRQSYFARRQRGELPEAY